VGGGSCTTPQPAPTWICVNGNWLPGTPEAELALTETPPGFAPASDERLIEMVSFTADRGFLAGRRPVLSI
jgi:hypothetical protein